MSPCRARGAQKHTKSSPARSARARGDQLGAGEQPLAVRANDVVAVTVSHDGERVPPDAAAAAADLDGTGREGLPEAVEVQDGRHGGDPMRRAPAGWYPDASHPRQPWTRLETVPHRHFDGAEWTDQVRVPAPANPSDSQPGSVGDLLVLPGLIAGVILVLMAFVALLPR